MKAGDLQTRVLARVGEDSGAAAGNQYYTAAEALAALNIAQRLFVLLTLCLETSATMELTPGVAFYSLLSRFNDWLLPLRFRGSKKLRPARLSDLAALDSAWSQAPGEPVKYALLGFDLLALYQQPVATEVLNVTYARCPVPLMNAWDVPEIPVEYHPCLIDGATPLMRTKEGGQEWQKTLTHWDRFLNEADRLAKYVRARNREQGYDYLPFELAKFDRSRMLEAMSGGKQ